MRTTCPSLPRCQVGNQQQPSPVTLLILSLPINPPTPFSYFPIVHSRDLQPPPFVLGEGVKLQRARPHSPSWSPRVDACLEDVWADIHSLLRSLGRTLARGRLSSSQSGGWEELAVKPHDISDIWSRGGGGQAMGRLLSLQHLARRRWRSSLVTSPQTWTGCLSVPGMPDKAPVRKGSGPL